MRVYSSALLAKISKEHKSIEGEFGHYNPSASAIITLARFSHINKLHFKDNCLYTEVDTLSGTPKGKILQEIIENNPESIAFRLRGIGSVTEKNGLVYIDETYKLVAIDAMNAENASKC